MAPDNTGPTIMVRGLPWRVLKDEASNSWVAVSDKLKLTAFARTLDELASVIDEIHEEVIKDGPSKSDD